ncbi:hypothetical protein [Methylobacterium crusticola]|uniref:hypothetical protein n=1 Tax=Methylobacterium crusticola TaxID=1697972 RepID=UPI000FFB37DF|nr:hypothetical protein [Methylobacterium crusticola]
MYINAESAEGLSRMRNLSNMTVEYIATDDVSQAEKVRLHVARMLRKLIITQSGEETIGKVASL